MADISLLPTLTDKQISGVKSEILELKNTIYTPERDKRIEELEKIPNLLESDVILIEKQPSFNPQMRIISTAIYVYFTLRLKYERGKKTKILYYSAKNKLKLCLETESLKSKNEQNLKGKKGKRTSTVAETLGKTKMNTIRKRDERA